MSVLDSSKAHQKYFEAISRIPRGSGNEKGVSDYVVSVAAQLGLEAYQDALWNVIVKKPASPGYEAAAPVMLQAHLDMVCVKSPDSLHDFERDPLKLYVEPGGHLRAEGTTLGADDGYGVAYLLAVMEESFPHPPLELVFTSQEENGCWGAKALELSRLQSRRMIGLDVMESTRENVVCVSCFCSDLLVLTRSCREEKAAGEALKIRIDGIQPFREGAQVHPELYNAIKLTARLLNDLLECGETFQLVSMRGGEAENYNPVCCETVLMTHNADSLRKQAFRLFSAMEQEVQDGRQSTRLEIGETGAVRMLSQADSRALVDAMLLVPSNTQSIDQRSQEMTSITCVGTVCLEDGEFTLKMSDRARADSYRKAIEQEMRAIARLTGCHLTVEERYAPWAYNPNSPMLRRTADLMRKFYGEDMLETICPGGLEACDFLPAIPDLDIVMFAPIGEKCHSTEEYLDLDSFDRVYVFLKTLLGEMRS